MVAKLKTLDDWLSCMDSLSPSTRSRLDQILAGFRPNANEFADDPLGYCRVYLGVKLWDKQREIIEKLMTPPYQVLVRAGHNVGKTFVAACLASWFYDSFNPSQTLCTAPTKASVRKCGGISQGGREKYVRLLAGHGRSHQPDSFLPGGSAWSG